VINLLYGNGENMKKFLIIALSLIVITGIALTVLIKIYVTPEKVKEYIIPVAEKALNRKVIIGEIDINIFKGIGLKDFTVKESDDKTDFIKCRDFVLKFQLMPLLAKKIVIDKLKIVSPSINIVRSREGKYNFEDIGKKDRPEEDSEDKEAGTTEGPPLSLLVRKISITDAKFSLTDLKRELPDFKSTTDIDISMKSAGGSDIFTQGTININLEEAVLRRPAEKHIRDVPSKISYTVTVNPESGDVFIKKADISIKQISASVKGAVRNIKNSPDADISVNLPKVKSAGLLELAELFTDLKDLNMSGSVSGDVRLKGNIKKPDSLSVSSSIALDQAGIKYKDISSSVDGDIKFTLKSDNLHLDRAVLKIDEIPVSVQGDIRKFKTSPVLDIALFLSKADTGRIQVLVSPFIKVKDINVSGIISADAKIKGDINKLDTLFVDSSLALDTVSVKYKDIHSSLAGNMKFTLKSGDIHIGRADLSIDKIPVSVKGDIRKFKTSPRLDISLSLPKAGADKLQAIAAPFAQVKGLSLSGHLAADLNVKGLLKKPESMTAKGNITLYKLGIAFNEVKGLLDGKIKLDNKTMNVDLRGSSGKNNARLRGSIGSLFKNQNIRLNVYSKKLFIDELEPVIKIGGKPSAAKSSTTAKSTVKEPEPINLNFSAGGEIKVDKAYYKGMVLDNFKMKYNFKNNKVNLTETGNAGKGRFSIKTLLDLSKPGYRYSMSGNVDSFHIEEFINAFFPKAKDTVYGLLTSKFKLNGSGTLPENMKKNLVADGDFKIIDGKISNSKIARELSLFVNISELETIEFNKAEGTVTVRKGIAKLNSIFTSDKIKMDPKGKIGLDETLDLAFDLKLSPRLTDKAVTSKIGKYLKDEGGWSSLPVLVTGTFSDPKYGPDIAKVGQKVIEKEVNKLLDKLLNKGRDKQQSPDTQKQPAERQQQRPQEGERQAPENPLQDLLEQLPGLFNK
jgi:uncharacterized protein involved in outer membrane biogenesis